MTLLLLLCFIFVLSFVSADVLVRQAHLNFNESEKNIVLIYSAKGASSVKNLDLALPLSNEPIPQNSSRVMLFNALQPPQMVDWAQDEQIISDNTAYASPIVYPLAQTPTNIPVIFIAYKAGTETELARLELDLHKDFPGGRKITITLVGRVGNSPADKDYPPQLLKHISEPINGNYATFCNLVPTNFRHYVTTDDMTSELFAYQKCTTVNVDITQDKSILTVWREDNIYVEREETYAPGNLTLLIVHHAIGATNRWLMSDSSVFGHQDHIILANTVLTKNVSWNSTQNIGENNRTISWTVSAKVQNPGNATFESLNISTSSEAHFQLVCFVGYGTPESPYRLINIELPFNHSEDGEHDQEKSATLCNFVENVRFKGLTLGKETSELGFTECDTIHDLPDNKSSFVVSRRDIEVIPPRPPPPPEKTDLNYARTLKHIHFSAEANHNIYAIWMDKKEQVQMTHVKDENVTVGKLFLMNAIGDNIIWQIGYYQKQLAKPPKELGIKDSTLLFDQDTCHENKTEGWTFNDNPTSSPVVLSLPLEHPDLVFHFRAKKQDGNETILGCASRRTATEVDHNSMVALVGNGFDGLFPYMMKQYNIDPLPDREGKTSVIICNTITRKHRFDITLYGEDGNVIRNFAQIGYKECVKEYVTPGEKAAFIFYSTPSIPPCFEEIEQLLSQKEFAEAKGNSVEAIVKSLNKAHSMETCSFDQNTCCELGVPPPTAFPTTSPTDNSTVDPGPGPNYGSGSIKYANNVCLFLVFLLLL